jgi:hypothetical protein
MQKPQLLEYLEERERVSTDAEVRHREMGAGNRVWYLELSSSCETNPKHVGSGVLTVVVMKGAIFWYVNRRFGGTFHLYHQGSVYVKSFRMNDSPPSSGSKISPVRNRHVSR